MFACVSPPQANFYLNARGAKSYEQHRDTQVCIWQYIRMRFSGWAKRQGVDYKRASRM
ncbi:hypothetical protein MPNT_50031 [Candidatus Methylacidithermus pantelleriae]|uniref:Uncharacterized protein n=1 Tax=Candidatus Methylacidithermus pantelleriae TaxID=2744239 RepID=A0A8J2BKB4_9BACT|nr:hypothetical protein MPNT_50031 [Candidatus Methylacidithermus pantelleriae]